jgi:hypothetical protein|tara:strand:- start:151 stop:540 length:390 start_codon:yes stop_codon:yes gene_type:complete
MEKSQILQAFNNHLIEFFNDIVKIFPDDREINFAYTSLSNIRKMNPKLIIGIWKNYINEKYLAEIESGNVDFFINENYEGALKDNSSSQEILSKIETLRTPIKLMGEENKKKTIKYLQNLSKLCNMYFN